MQKPLSVKINELKEQLLSAIVHSELHPTIAGYVLNEIEKEVSILIEKSNEYEQQEYEKSIKLIVPENQNEEEINDGKNQIIE